MFHRYLLSSRNKVKWDLDIKDLTICFPGRLVESESYNLVFRIYIWFLGFYYLYHSQYLFYRLRIPLYRFWYWNLFLSHPVAQIFLTQVQECSQVWAMVYKVPLPPWMFLKSKISMTILRSTSVTLRYDMYIYFCIGVV